jgi:glycerophosphoryl diester phosphodiesterase
MSEEAGPVLPLRFLFARTGKDLWHCLPQLLIFDILFKILAFVLLSPLLAGLFRVMIGASGSRAIGNTDILLFLLSPLGLATLVLVVPAGFAVVFLELAGLMAIGMGAASGRFVGWYAALRFAFGRFSRIVGLSMFWLLLAAVSLLPFAAAGLLVHRLLLSGHDINYYLQLKPPEFRTAFALGVCLAAGAALVLAALFTALAFALPLSLFGEASHRRAVTGSLKLVRKHYRRVAPAILAWLVSWGLFSGVVNAAVNMAGKMLVGAAGEKMHLLVPLLGTVVAIDVLSGVIIAFAGTAFGCLLVARLFRELRGEAIPESTFLEQMEKDPRDGPRKPVPRRALIAAAAVALVIAVVTSLALLETVSLEDRVEITAHRGFSLAAPENTLSAVEGAIAVGADMVEFDVQETADGAIVVVHDADLMRMAGEPLVVTKTAFGRLRKVDVGSRFGEEFAGERIPTLEEVIDTARGKIRLNVELKTYAGDYRRLAEKVVRTLEERHMTDDAVIMSLEYKEVQEVRRLNPGLTVGFTPAAAIGDITRLDCDFLAVSASMAQGTLIAAAHDQGKEIHVWTVNDPVDISTMIDRGVDNIITDDPAEAVKVLEERAALSNTERLLLRFKSLYVN